MRILLCSDQPDILQLLQEYVEEFFRNFADLKPEMVSFGSREELLSSDCPAADIAFLGVRLSGDNGFSIGKRLMELHPGILLFMVSADPEHADDVMRYGAFRHVQTPIDKDRLLRNMKDAMVRIAERSVKLAIETIDGIVALRSEEIICIESLMRQVRMITTVGEHICISSLNHLRKQLMLPCFYAPHRSYLINMRYVRTFTRDQIILEHEGTAHTAYLTKRRYAEFKDHYMLYSASMKARADLGMMMAFV